MGDCTKLNSQRCSLLFGGGSSSIVCPIRHRQRPWLPRSPPVLYPPSPRRPPPPPQADINATRLTALAAELAAAGGPSAHPTVITATLDGKTNLTAFVSRAKAVITAAGPFSVHDGDALLSACARNGVHYADISDEFYWQRRMVDGYDQLARVSGAKVNLVPIVHPRVSPGSTPAGGQSVVDPRMIFPFRTLHNGHCPFSLFLKTGEGLAQESRRIRTDPWLQEWLAQGP